MKYLDRFRPIRRFYIISAIFAILAKLARWGIGLELELELESRNRKSSVGSERKLSLKSSVERLNTSHISK